MKLPVPVPSVDLLFAMVGPAEVFQQTPLAMIEVLPIEEILPPPEAEFEVMEIMGEVAIVAANPSVLNAA